MPPNQNRSHSNPCVADPILRLDHLKTANAELKKRRRLLHDDFMRTVATAANVSSLRAERVYHAIGLVLSDHFARKGEPVEIEGFGKFYRVNVTVAFRPDNAVMTKINNSTPSSRAPLILKKERRGLVELRQHDRELIDQFVSARTSISSDTERALFGSARSIKSKTTSVLATRSLRAFSRKCQVPLVDVDRKAVLAVAEIYAVAAWPRILNANPLAQKEDVWKTTAWRHTVTFAKDFYDWLEETGQRPIGSNPFTGMRRYYTPLPFSQKHNLIVRAWYEDLLAYRYHPPLTKAVLFLAANGLRRGEIAAMRRTDVDLDAGTVRVKGKGSRVRLVHMMPQVVEAVRRFLNSNADFPDSIDVFRIVRRAASRVFDDPEKLRHIHPHGLRHFFVTTAMRAGMSVPSIMRITGHTSERMLFHYRSADDAEVTEELKKLPTSWGGT